jgi:hypothetical protein
MEVNSKSVRIFLDTNTLIAFLKEDRFAKYAHFSVPIQFVTFEKCLYEWKNGLKRCFLKKDFLVACIKNRCGQKIVNVGSYEERAAQEIVAKVLDELRLPAREEVKLIEALKKYDLRFEFGIAEEYQWQSVEDMEERFCRFVRREEQGDTGVLWMKQFYRLVKPFLLKFYGDMDEKLKAEKVEIVYYDTVFGNPARVLDFRHLMESSYLPTEDLEIVFSAIATECGIFLTNDKKVRDYSLTLGLNHITNFRRLDELDDALEEYVGDVE